MTKRVRSVTPHGTRPRYQQGCRCHPCTMANSDYLAEYRLRTGRTRRMNPYRGRTPPHGTRARYQRGCQCDDCNDANNAYVNDWNRSRRQGA